MKILVTGGAGFLGSHLCERLLDDDNEVICLDDFCTGSKKNMRHLGSRPGFELLQGDVREPIYLKVNGVYNLACAASPVHYQADSLKTFWTNILGTQNMLDLARRNGCRMIQASTSEVYGDPLEQPQSESYWGNVNPNGIRACYDEGKRAAETLAMIYKRKYGTNVGIVRIFNTYGPRMAVNDGRVVSNFIVQALKGEDLTVYGNGQQTRSFCYVSDLIGGLVKMMESDEIGPINLGNPEEFTILELAHKIIGLIGSTSSVIEGPLPEDDPTKRNPDITLAREKLGWEPIVHIDEGLRRTIGYFKNSEH